jgi:hypothetical protein
MRTNKHQQGTSTSTNKAQQKASMSTNKPQQGTPTKHNTKHLCANENQQTTNFNKEHQ